MTFIYERLIETLVEGGVRPAESGEGQATRMPTYDLRPLCDYAQDDQADFPYSLSLPASLYNSSKSEIPISPPTPSPPTLPFANITNRSPKSSAWGS